MKLHSRIILKVDKRLKNLFQNNFKNIAFYSHNEVVPEEGLSKVYCNW